jgi:hypothetical protein
MFEGALRAAFITPVSNPLFHLEKNMNASASVSMNERKAEENHVNIYLVIFLPDRIEIVYRLKSFAVSIHIYHAPSSK